MSIYPLFLDGWEATSTWGDDGGYLYAQLTRNGVSDANGPEHVIMPPRYPLVRTAAELAPHIARVTGTDQATVLHGMDVGATMAGATDADRRHFQLPASGLATSSVATAPAATLLITVRGIEQKCWRCYAASGAVVALHPRDDLRYESACWHSDEPVLALANELLTQAGQTVVAGQITERYSRTRQGRYLSNGCHKCGALFGEFFLGEAVMEIAANDGTLADLRLLATAPVDVRRWTSLLEERTSFIG